MKKRSVVKSVGATTLATTVLTTAALTIAVLVFLVGMAPEIASANTLPLMRFPDIHGNTIVFVCGEDIWTAPATGGIATRLTIHDGAERYPKFSPDGSSIAFTGAYDGNNDVYVMNVHGGNITRVTYHPDVDVVIGWHPVKNKIIFSSGRNAFNRYTRLYMINPDGTGLEELIMHEAARGSFSPDGKKIAYNRVAREHRTWKRYKGGLAQDIYLFDFEKMQDRKLTEFDGTDRIPMWIGDRVYFSSDRDRVLNIYALDPATGAVEQITDHKEYDIRRPSEGSGKIVYELGGDIWSLDTVSGKTAKVDIQVMSDAEETRPYFKHVGTAVTDVDCSPAGERLLVSARGEIFSVPKEHGITRNLSNSSGSRDKDPVWSPDGNRIAYLSDKSGEYEIYVVAQDGSDEAIKLTSHVDGYRHSLRWSPDSRKIAYTDQTLTCYYIDVDSKKITKVDRAEYENVDVSLDLKPIYDFAWSPDSRYITYSKLTEEGIYQVFVYSLDTGKKHCVSDGLFNDFHPVFSKCGKHLLFVSNRRFSPTFCDFEWEMVYKDVAGIYSLTLEKGGQSLLPFRNDEVEVSGGGGEKGKKEKSRKGKNSYDKAVSIDFDGIAGRIEHLPLPPGNYRYLSAGDGEIFYLHKDDGDFNRFEFRAMGRMDLFRFSLEDREAKKVIAGIDEYRLSFDGEKVVYRQGINAGIIDVSDPDSDSDLEGTNIDLSGLSFLLDPVAEWRQIFDEAWRMERDFYYEPNMHGADWDAMKVKYGALIDRATCRQDLGFIVGELIGELNTSHTYVYGGDFKRNADHSGTGMLGVDWKVEKGAEYYRFEKIFRVPDWTREIIPPLARPGSEVADGEYLIAVNGTKATTDMNVYSYFQGLAGQQVKLLVNDKPSMKGAREINVAAARGEKTLRYLDWVEHNRKLAGEKSGGKIGYIHLPDTYTGSAREFPKYFYAQTRKKSLIIDGRFNGGGLDPAIFYQRLNKKHHSYWTRRYSADQGDPLLAPDAHMVCLTNRQAGSGGDMVPMEFQMMKMGPVIGTRTWGGLVGVSMFLRLIDGGGLTAPDYRIYTREGKWIVENEGVTPDIIVDLDPVEMSKGHDAQLEKAIEVLMEEMKNDPKSFPKHDPFKVDK